MRKIIAIILSLALLLSCAAAMAEPAPLHVEMGGYSLDLTVLDVRIEEDKLHVDCIFENNDKCGVGSALPMVYAVYDGKKYEADSYSARISGISSSNLGAMLLSGVTFNIPYGPAELPAEIYAEATPDHYEQVWANPGAAPEAAP